MFQALCTGRKNACLAFGCNLVFDYCQTAVHFLLLLRNCGSSGGDGKRNECSAASHVIGFYLGRWFNIRLLGGVFAGCAFLTVLRWLHAIQQTAYFIV